MICQIQLFALISAFGLLDGWMCFHDLMYFAAMKVTLNPAPLQLSTKTRALATGLKSSTEEPRTQNPKLKRMAGQKSHRSRTEEFTQDLVGEKRPASPPQYSITKLQRGSRRWRRRKDQREEAVRDVWRSVRG